jgi:hypothetical protein
MKHMHTLASRPKSHPIKTKQTELLLKHWRYPARNTEDPHKATPVRQSCRQEYKENPQHSSTKHKRTINCKRNTAGTAGLKMEKPADMILHGTHHTATPATAQDQHHRE